MVVAFATIGGVVEVVVVVVVVVVADTAAVVAVVVAVAALAVVDAGPAHFVVVGAPPADHLLVPFSISAAASRCSSPSSFFSRVAYRQLFLGSHYVSFCLCCHHKCCTCLNILQEHLAFPQQQLCEDRYHPSIHTFHNCI